VDVLTANLDLKGWGMSVSNIGRFVCWVTLALTPASLVAADQAAAMVYSKGTVWLNGNPLPDSSAILQGDLLQTKTNSVASITASGSSVILQPESLLKFGENAVSLEQGSMNVASSSGLVASAGGVTVTPASNVWTEFEVTDVNGMVEILSRKGNVSVNCGKDTVSLSEGMQIISDGSGKCKKRRKSGAYPPTSGDILNSPYLKYIAAAAGAGTLIWLLWPSPQTPASPAVP